MPKTDSKLKLQVARNDDHYGSKYVIGINLVEAHGPNQNTWVPYLRDGLRWYSEMPIEYFEAVFKVCLRPGSGPITIADSDNPLALPVREGEG